MNSHDPNELPVPCPIEACQALAGSPCGRWGGDSFVHMERFKLFKEEQQRETRAYAYRGRMSGSRGKTNDDPTG